MFRGLESEKNEGVIYGENTSEKTMNGRKNWIA